MRTKSASGFTLVELLVVLVILGLLAGLVGPQVMKHVGSSKSRTARLQIEELSAALEIYRLEVGAYPTPAQGLTPLVEPPAGATVWNGPYLRKAVLPRDPWGREFRYRQSAKHGAFELYSLGADGVDGGEGENADVMSWK